MQILFLVGLVHLRIQNDHWSFLLIQSFFISTLRIAFSNNLRSLLNASFQIFRVLKLWDV